MYLIGNSIDIHKIQMEECLIKLGGIAFESTWKIIAHSDGDVIIHALAEAIYGALGLGDLGDHFSDKDPLNKNLDSKFILEDALAKMQENKFKINNVDITIISEHIIFKNIKLKILNNLSLLTGCKKINIKATRWEEDKKMIQANCSVLLKGV